MIDFWADAVPNWIAAVSTFMALIAAGIAAGFAGHAARSTAAQAAAARRQVELVDQQLTLTRAELARSSEEAQRTQRVMAESRIDVLMPEVTASMEPETTHPATPVLTVLHRVSDSWPVTGLELREPLRIEYGQLDDYRIRFTMTLRFRNVSGKTARIVLPNVSALKVEETLQSESILLPWGDTTGSETCGWYTVDLSARVVLGRNRGLFWSANATFFVSFEVRDLGKSACDEGHFYHNLSSYFGNDGSALIIDPSPRDPLSLAYAEYQIRRYEALERTKLT